MIVSKGSALTQLSGSLVGSVALTFQTTWCSSRLAGQVRYGLCVAQLMQQSHRNDRACLRRLISGPRPASVGFESSGRDHFFHRGRCARNGGSSASPYDLCWSVLGACVTERGGRNLGLRQTRTMGNTRPQPAIVIPVHERASWPEA